MSRRATCNLQQFKNLNQLNISHRVGADGAGGSTYSSPHPDFSIFNKAFPVPQACRRLGTSQIPAPKCRPAVGRHLAGNFRPKSGRSGKQWRASLPDGRMSAASPAGTRREVVRAGAARARGSVERGQASRSCNASDSQEDDQAWHRCPSMAHSAGTKTGYVGTTATSATLNGAPNRAARQRIRGVGRVILRRVSATAFAVQNSAAAAGVRPCVA